MLYANTGGAARTEIADPAAEALQHATWIDVVSPTDAERAAVEHATGLRVPTMKALSEIESSSRLAQAHGVLTLSMPFSTPGADGMVSPLPLGMVVSAGRLLTVRFGAAPVFETFAAQFAAEPQPADGRIAFLGLLEAIVDRLADVLEQLRGELDQVSHAVFRPTTARDGDPGMRDALRTIGRSGDRLGAIRDSLLGVERIAQYAAPALEAALPEADRPRIAALRQDVASLSDYDKQLTDKVQFLLDATLGLINIDQNNKINVLTVVSVVGVPPTLVASIYGMNFQNMPEYHWAFGYQYGLTLLVLSAAVPLIWFKAKRWV